MREFVRQQPFAGARLRIETAAPENDVGTRRERSGPQGACGLQGAWPAVHPHPAEIVPETGFHERPGGRRQRLSRRHRLRPLFRAAVDGVVEQPGMVPLLAKLREALLGKLQASAMGRGRPVGGHPHPGRGHRNTARHRGLHGLADLRLRVAVAVGLGRVEEIDAVVVGVPDHVGLCDAPAAHADVRHPETGAAQGAVPVDAGRRGFGRGGGRVGGRCRRGLAAAGGRGQGRGAAGGEESTA